LRRVFFLVSKCSIIFVVEQLFVNIFATICMDHTCGRYPGCLIWLRDEMTTQRIFFISIRCTILSFVIEITVWTSEKLVSFRIGIFGRWSLMNH
jgi:hypothetical protein